MKPQLITLFLALILGFIGGKGSQTLRSKPAPEEQGTAVTQRAVPDPSQSGYDAAEMDFQITQMQDRIASLEAQLSRIAQEGITPNAGEDPAGSDGGAGEPPGETVSPPPARSEADYLAAIGVDPGVASDILRRISQQQFRAMELRNLMRNTGSSDRQVYSEELRELNRNRISLRSELGDEKYDEYLFVSGQSNRVEVNSVMAGSPAEDYGVQPGDVVLFYNDTKIIEIRDLQRAALSGEAGGYGNIEILRDGNRMNLMLPHGTMGVQLRPKRIDPTR